MPLRELARDLWILEHPMRVMGMNFGTRTTVFRLSSGELALHSPGAMAPAQTEAIDNLGPVTVLIAPNMMHYLSLKAAHERWPAARVLIPQGLAEKRPEFLDAEVMAPQGELDLAHGDPIEHGGKALFRDAYSFLLDRRP